MNFFKKKYFFTFIAGLIFSLGYPNLLLKFSLGPLPVIIGTCIFLKNISLNNLKNIFIHLYFFIFAIAIFGFYWIPQTIATFGNLPLIVGYLLFALFIPFLCLHLWPSFYFIHKLNKKVSHPLSFIFFSSVILTLMEIWIPSQFPVHFGQAWIDWSFALGLTPVFGLPLFSFVNYLTSFSLLHKQWKALSLSIFVILFSICIKPFTFNKSSLLKKSDQSLKIRFVQANIGNFLKTQSELGQFSSMNEVYERYESLSLEKPNDRDLIIWPETAFPKDINTAKLIEKPHQYDHYLKNIVEKSNSSLLFGSYDIGQLEKSENDFQTVYNSSTLITSKGFKHVYHKQQLIPFGETLPLGPMNKYLKDHVPGVSFFSKGFSLKPFQIKSRFYFVSPICYEILDPHFIRKLFNNSQQRINFMVNLTNDSWYGRTAEPYQHLFLTKWRAIELQTPLLRSTNSGLTSVIDIDGKESDRLLLGEVKKLDFNLYIHPFPKTIYQRFGNLLLYTFFISLLLFLYYKQKHNLTQKNH